VAAVQHVLGAEEVVAALHVSEAAAAHVPEVEGEAHAAAVVVVVAAVVAVVAVVAVGGDPTLHSSTTLSFSVDSTTALASIASAITAATRPMSA